MCYSTALIMLCVFERPFISHPVTDNNNVPTHLFFPNFEIILDRRLDLSGVDCFSLTPNDSMFGLKLIFTANWNKVASIKYYFYQFFPLNPMLTFFM